MEKAVKGGKAGPRLVAVILSQRDFAAALRLRRRPDFFELRLDALADLVLPPGEPNGPAEDLRSTLGGLGAPLIMTARDPREGGLNELSGARRQQLLTRFLPQAAAVDVELRNVTSFQSLLAQVKNTDLELILSLHNMRSRTTRDQLFTCRDDAVRCGADVLKLVLRLDSHGELDQLIDFIASTPLPVSAAGVGSLARESRLKLPRAGSALNYAHLGRAAVPGQLSLSTLRRIIGAI